jgi:cytoskeleton protein RodZ
MIHASLDGQEEVAARRRNVLHHPGAILRQARESQQLSLETVAQQLHMSARALKALEENDTAKLPPPVYVKAFLRSYARLMQIPEQEVLAGFSVTEPGLSVAPTLDDRPLRQEQRSLLPAMLGLGAVGALALFMVVRSGSQAPSPRPTDVSGEIALPAASEPAAEPERTARPELSVPAPPPSSTAPAATAQPFAPGPNQTALGVHSSQPGLLSANPAQTAVAAAAPSPPTGIPGSDALVLRFSGESWVTVVDAGGNRLLYEAGQPGTMKSVTGKAPLKVTLGRPGNVEIEFNGQPYGRRFEARSGPVRLRIGAPEGG